MTRHARFSRRQLGAFGLVAGTAALLRGSGGAQSAFAGPTTMAPSGSPKPQHSTTAMRAEWIASVQNMDWPSRPGLSARDQQAEYTALLDTAVANKLNAVFVQVRPTADAFWPSPYEPWSHWLTGQQGRDPGYDPLAFAIEQAHRRGLRIHAWFNPYRISMQGDPNTLVPDHPAREHPKWTFSYGDKLYYNPGVPAARTFVEKTIMHVVEHYDVDGVHLDDYFYPYPVQGQAIPDQHTFETYGAGFGNIEDWRRHNVNLLVSELHHAIHTARPHVRFGISPFGIWRNRSSDPAGSPTRGSESYSLIYADTLTWIKQGWVDYINPQLYWNLGHRLADYAALVPWWAHAVEGTDVELYIGQGAYRMGKPGWDDVAELSRHLSFNREHPRVDGDVYFSATSLSSNAKDAMARVVADHYR